MLGNIFKRHPMISRFTVFLFIPILFVLAGIYWKVILSLPMYSGDKYINGITGPVTVKYDKQGTPSVLAQSDADAYFIQGYLHASERMWQMELQRRTVQGRLSEVLGRAAFPTDIWMRTLGLRPSAKKSWDSLGKSAQQALIAYSRGVNAWLAQAKTLPPEFLALGITPEPWNEIDSLAWQKVLALDLGLNMYREIDRLTALKVISPEQLKVFYEYDPDLASWYSPQNKQKITQDTMPNHTLSLTENVTSPAKPESPHFFDSFDSLSDHLQNQLGLGIPYAGSNAWTVSGKFTKSGKPILANDPHLSIQQNSPWYSIQMKGDKLDVTGMSLVGIPGVALGRNRNIAWGATSLMSDQQDLFYLNIPVGNNKNYALKEGLVEIEVENETFNIKADTPEILNKEILPVKFEIRRTPIGPIVSDAVKVKDETVVLRWAALDDNDRSFEAFHQLQYAKNWAEFREAISLLKAPGLNFVYADTEGNIGSQVGGHIPLRGKGVGIIPQRAESIGDLWQGYVPFSKLPYSYNPESGIVISANNKIVSDDDVIISHEWASDARSKRIQYLLDGFIEKGQAISIDDMVKIQNDQVDLNSKTLLSVLTNEKVIEAIKHSTAKKDVERVNKALEILSTWDSDYRINSVAATIYEAWINKLRKEIFYNELNPAWNNAKVTLDFILTVSEVQIAQILKNQNNSWCDNGTKIPCEKELINSFNSALELIERLTGSNNVDDWQWGELHQVKLAHSVFSTIMQKPFTKTMPMGGALNTVNVSLWVNSPTGGYQKSLGASFRHVFDLGLQSDSGSGSGEMNSYVIPTGQSGHILNEHYKDQTTPYLEGRANYYMAPPNNNESKPNLNPVGKPDLEQIHFYPKKELPNGSA